MRGATARHFDSVRPRNEVTRVTSYHPGYHLNRVTTQSTTRPLWRVFAFHDRNLERRVPEGRDADPFRPQSAHAFRGAGRQARGQHRRVRLDQPILVDGSHGIIAGHGRLAAARKLGLTEVPVIELGHLSPAQKRAYVIADNRLALDAGWDEEMLAAELAELTESGYDLTLTGFSNEEIEDLLVDGGKESSADSDDDAADEVPDTPVNPVSRPGDVWQLGAHRVICGDAADATVVAALMAGEQAALCFTSPPYGNQRDYTNTIIDWDALMRGVFNQLPMAANGQVLVNLGLIHRDNEVIPYWDGWLDWMRTQGWRRFAWYVWDQGPGLPGDWNGRLAPSFEFVFHFNRQARQANKIMPCKFAGQETHLRKDGSSTAMRKKDGTIGGWTAAGTPTQDTKIPDSVIRIMRHKGKIGQDIDHPAVFPGGTARAHSGNLHRRWRHRVRTVLRIRHHAACGTADWPHGPGHRDCTRVCRCDDQALPAELPGGAGHAGNHRPVL
jgi:DNA modification methylase